jgi:transposase InsO family protein
VCGPISYSSLTSNLYYVSFVDDSSHKIWIYFMNNKDVVFFKFKEVKALAENQIGKKIKVLRSNNGGEYTSKYFDVFCREPWIRRDLTVPYNPQYNGFVKRNNRSIIETNKVMIYGMDFLCVFVQRHATQ